MPKGGRVPKGRGRAKRFSLVNGVLLCWPISGKHYIYVISFRQEKMAAVRHGVIRHTFIYA